MRARASRSERPLTPTLSPAQVGCFSTSASVGLAELGNTPVRRSGSSYEQASIHRSRDAPAPELCLILCILAISRGERSAERRKFIWSAPHQQMSPLARAFGRGSAPNSGRARLPALHCGSRQGLSPVGSAPGQASWDAVSAGVTRLLLSQSRESTSRTGRSTGEHDAQNRPGADCKSARGDRPCSAIGYASRVRPSNEQGDCVCNIIGDECQGHRLRLRDAGRRRQSLASDLHAARLRGAITS